MPSTISRRFSYRGQRVVVTMRDRTQPDVTGTIIGWGPRLMQLNAETGGSDYREIANSSINRVYQA